jgi:DNA-binding NarL/FixJ family response regulator
LRRDLSLSHRKPVKLRCLLVDDSEEFLASAARLLESQGLDVVGCATRRSEALELAASLEPDVALVDIELADEDGIVLARELAAQAPSTRIVLISAYDQEELSEVIAGSPAAGFLSKSDLGVDGIRRLVSVD